MKFQWDYEFSKGQKQLLVIVSLFLVAVIWYRVIYCPVGERMVAADTAILEEELMLEQVRASKIRTMKQEIEENRSGQNVRIPSYDNLKGEMEELNRILAPAHNFTLHISEPKADGMIVQRKIAVTFEADDYDIAAGILEKIEHGAYANRIDDVDISGKSQEYAADIKCGAVEVMFQLTYYETRYGADTEEGLKMKPAQKEK